MCNSNFIKPLQVKASSRPIKVYLLNFPRVIFFFEIKLVPTENWLQALKITAYVIAQVKVIAQDLTTLVHDGYPNFKTL